MNQEWLKYKLIVFDLDNTLYCETDYLFAAYHRIAEECAATREEEDIYWHYLCTSFNREGRKDLFQRFKAKYSISISIAQMISILRSTECELTLFEAQRSLIEKMLEAGKHVAILTNGNIEQQQQKVNNLRIQFLFPQIRIVYAAQYESKPSPAALQSMMADFEVLPSETLFIGDSEIDKETADRAKVNFTYYV